MNTKKTTKKAAPAKAVKTTIIEVTEAPEAVTEVAPTVEATEPTEAAQAPIDAELDVTATEVAEPAQAPTEAHETVETEGIITEELAAIDAGLDKAEAAIEAIEQAIKPTKTAKAEKVAKPTSPRYEAAAAEVSRTNQDFLAALDEKAALLGTTRVNESVGVYNHPDAHKINEAIHHCRMELEALLERKRNLKVKVDGLDEVNEKVSLLRRQRDKARQEKKAAMAELKGTAKTDAMATEQEDEAKVA